jgi:cytochrome oxidase Cu insertion factor (SCO1/SenC/PrrC family)
MRNTLRYAMTLSVLLAIPISLFAAGGAGELVPKGIKGNILGHAIPAADFTLSDQHGMPFRMADARGKVVLMSFIYTHCTDLCPFIALKLKDAWQLLAADAKDVEIVLVTTDPRRDTQSVTSAYSKALGMNDVWRYLSGPSDAVHKVWADYGIGVTVDTQTGAVLAVKEKKSEASESAPMAEEEPTQGLSKTDLALAGQIIANFGGGYDVGHSAPFWFVDKKGVIRAGMDADAAPADLAAAVRVLLKLR